MRAASPTWLSPRLMMAQSLAFLLVATIVAEENWPRSRKVSLRLTGPAGQNVAGTYTVNGVPRLYAAVLPAEISVPASRFSYALWSPHGLKGTLTVEGREIGSSSTQNAETGIHGHTEFSGYLAPIKWTRTTVLPRPAFERAQRVGKT